VSVSWAVSKNALISQSLISENFPPCVCNSWEALSPVQPPQTIVRPPAHVSPRPVAEGFPVIPVPHRASRIATCAFSLRWAIQVPINRPDDEVIISHPQGLSTAPAPPTTPPASSATTPIALKRLAAGEFKSVRAAAKTAGASVRENIDVPLAA
jgi:hypothetical protein